MSKKANKQRYTIYLGASVLLFVVAVLWARADTVAGLELSVFRIVNDWPQGLYALFLVVTQAGSAWMLFGLTLLLLGMKRNRLALRVFGAGAAAFVLSEVILKHLIARERPFTLVTNVHVREFGHADYGFPSAHTAVATAMALVIMMVLPKRWRWLAPVWILAVALSRIYLGVHAPLDVVGGFAVGAFVVTGSLLIRGKLKSVLKITHLKLQG